MVWFPDNIPGIHSSVCCLLMMYYALNTKLVTRDKWEICVVYRSQIKSGKQKPSVFQRFHQDIKATSFEIVFFQLGIKGGRFQMSLGKISPAATIYSLWLQRKTRIQNGNVIYLKKRTSTIKTHIYTKFKGKMPNHRCQNVIFFFHFYCIVNCVS